jgi:hypothetical protein
VPDLTPSAIVAELRRRGAQLEVVDAGGIKITPRSVLDDRLRAAIRAHLADVAALVRCAGADPATPARKAERPPSPVVDYDVIYAETLGELGTTEEDVPPSAATPS